MAEETGKEDSEQIEQSGDGAIATGGSTAVGAGGVGVGGNVKKSNIVTGDGNVTVSGGDVITGGTVTKNYAAPERTVDALHQLPAPPADFTGRGKELRDLQAKIGGGVTISGIRGMGGIGKTALALKLAELLTPGYPEAQFYLDLRGADQQEPLTPMDAMRHVILSLEPAVKLPDDPQGIAGLYYSLLEGRRALFLWDNARDADQVGPLLAGGCLALVTSRGHFGLPGMERLDLDIMSPKEARALIRVIAPGVKAGEADEIAKLCDYLPLAIRLAAGALAEREDLPPAQYARRLGDLLGNLGNAYADLGEAREAVEFYEKQLAITREVGDPRGEGQVLRGLGNAYAALGEAREAIAFYEQALAISREIGDRRGEALGSWNLGLAYEGEGELQKAVDAMQICVDFERELGHPDAEADAARLEQIRKKLGGSKQ